MADSPPSSVPGARQIANIAAFRLLIGARDISSAFRPRLISLSLTEKRGGEADELSVSVDDSKGDIAIPDTGEILTLSLGWRQGAGVTPGMVAKGRFKVDEAGHSGPPDIVTLRARSADLDGGFRVRKERSWKDTTIGAVLGQIAGENGFTAQISGDLAGIAVPVLDQHEMSDMALLRQLGREHDAIATVKDRKLIFAPIGAGVTASGSTIAPAEIARSKGDRHDYRRAEREKYDGAEARWHDQGSATRKTEKAGSTGNGGKPKRLKKIYATQADARAAANAEAKRISRGEAEMTLNLALGDPSLFPDRKVKLTGFKPEIEAHDWLIAEVTHTLDSGGGLRTSLKLEAAG